jgi:hypothetical protein
VIRVGAVLHCMPSATCFTPTAIKRRKFGALESTTEQHDLWLPCCTDWHNQIEPTCSCRNSGSYIISYPSFCLFVSATICKMLVFALNQILINKQYSSCMYSSDTSPTVLQYTLLAQQQWRRAAFMQRSFLFKLHTYSKLNTS